MKDGKIQDAWIHTSVDDLRITLQCCHGDGHLALRLPDLRATLEHIRDWTGHATRRRVLASFIRMAMREETRRTMAMEKMRPTKSCDH